MGISSFLYQTGQHYDEINYFLRTDQIFYSDWKKCEQSNLNFIIRYNSVFRWQDLCAYRPQKCSLQMEDEPLVITPNSYILSAIRVKAPKSLKNWLGYFKLLHSMCLLARSLVRSRTQIVISNYTQVYMIAAVVFHYPWWYYLWRARKN